MTGSTSRPGRVIAGMGVAQIVSWGSLFYAFPLLAVPMGAELGWTKTQSYLLASLSLGLQGLAAYPVGRAIDRGYGRQVMVAGSLLAALSLALWSVAHSVWTLLIAFAGIGVAQAMALYEPAFAIIARCWGDRAREGMTSLTLWGGFASTVFVPVTQGLLDQCGWRGALLGLAVFNLLVNLPVHAWLVRPDGPDTARAGADADTVQADDQAVAWAVRRWSFWGLMLSFMAYVGVFTGLTVHLYPLLAERSMDAAHIVMVIAIIGPAQVAGRIAVAGFARSAPIWVVGLASTGTLALSVLMLAMAGSSFWALALFALVFGGANGIITIVRGAAVPELLTRRAYGAINGLLATPVGIMRALSPTLAALLYGVTGGYDGALTVLIGLAVFMVVMFWTVVHWPAAGAGGDGRRAEGPSGRPR